MTADNIARKTAEQIDQLLGQLEASSADAGTSAAIDRATDAAGTPAARREAMITLGAVVSHSQQAGQTIPQPERLQTVVARCISDDDATLRLNAVALAGSLGAAALQPALLARLHDDNDALVRERAAIALAQLGDLSIIPQLADVALEDASPLVQRRLAYILGASRDVRAVSALLRLSRSPVATIRASAAWALGLIGASAAEAVEPVYPVLRQLLDDEQPAVRADAAWALGEIGDNRAVEPLLAHLQDSYADVRGRVAWALGTLAQETGRVDVIAPLVGLLDDFATVQTPSHVFVCQFAGEALSQLADPQAQAAVESWRPRVMAALLPYRIDELVSLLATDRTPQRQEGIRRLVALFTQMTGEPNTSADERESRRQDLLGLLHERLAAPSNWVRGAIAQVLAQAGDASSTRPLVEALADADMGVWSQAVAALAALDDADKTLQLAYQTARSNRDTTTHTKAVAGDDEPDSDAAPPDVTTEQARSRQVRVGLALALWRRNREELVWRDVLQALTHPEPIVRTSAMTALMHQPDERALATLQIALERESGVLVQYVLQALHALDTAGAQATIQRYMAAHPPAHGHGPL